MKMAAVLSQRSSCHQYNPFSSWVVRLRRMPSFACHITQDALQIQEATLAWLRTSKIGGDAGVQMT
jgi:hypothetical protein